MGQRLVLPDPNPCASGPRPPDFCRSMGGGALVAPSPKVDRSLLSRLADDASYRARTHAGHVAELSPLRDPPPTVRIGGVDPCKIFRARVVHRHRGVIS